MSKKETLEAFCEHCQEQWTLERGDAFRCPYCKVQFNYAELMDMGKTAISFEVEE